MLAKAAEGNLMRGSLVNQCRGHCSVWDHSQPQGAMHVELQRVLGAASVGCTQHVIRHALGFTAVCANF